MALQGRLKNGAVWDGDTYSLKYYGVSKNFTLLNRGKNTITLTPDSIIVPGSTINVELFDKNNRRIPVTYPNQVTPNGSIILRVNITEDIPGGVARLYILGTSRINADTGEELDTSVPNVLWRGLCEIRRFEDNDTPQDSDDLVFDKPLKDIKVSVTPVDHTYITPGDDRPSTYSGVGRLVYFPVTEPSNYNTGTKNKPEIKSSNTSSPISENVGSGANTSQGVPYPIIDSLPTLVSTLEEFTSDMVGGVITAEPIVSDLVPPDKLPSLGVVPNYVGTIVEVINSKTLRVDTHFNHVIPGAKTANDYIVKSFSSNVYSIRYNTIGTPSPTQKVTGYAKMCFSNVSTSNGVVDKVRVFAKPVGALGGSSDKGSGGGMLLGDYDIIPTSKIEDTSSYEFDPKSGLSYKNPGKVTSNADVNMYFDSAEYVKNSTSNSAFDALSYSPTGASISSPTNQNDKVLNAVSTTAPTDTDKVIALSIKDAFSGTAKAGTEYSIKFDAYSEKDISGKSPLLRIFISGAPIATPKKTSDAFGTLIAEVDASSGSTQMGLEYFFEVLEDSNNLKVYFVLESGRWDIGNINIKAASSTGNTPNEFCIFVPLDNLPVNKIGEEYVFFLEFVGKNGNPTNYKIITQSLTLNTNTTIDENLIINTFASSPTIGSLISGSFNEASSSLADRITSASGSLIYSGSWVEGSCTINLHRNVCSDIPIRITLPNASSYDYWTVSDGSNGFNVFDTCTVTITGSAAISSSLQGSIITTYLDTGSAHFNDGIKTKLNIENVVSGSSQIIYNQISDIPEGIVSGSSQVIYNQITGIPDGLVSGSSQIIYNQVTGIPSGILSSSQAWNITDGISLTNVPSGSTLYFTGSDAIAFDLINSTTGSITLDTGSAHFNDGIKTKLNIENVVSGSANLNLWYKNGAKALSPSGSGGTNVFLGANAGNATTSGQHNNFLGFQAGCSNTTGACNNFFGYQAGWKNTFGRENNFFGGLAGQQNTSGCQNNFFGYGAGACNTTGCDNNFFGFEAGWLNISGCCNNFIGHQAGAANTTGCHNNSLGYLAGGTNTTGNYNNFLGFGAGYGNVTGACNVFIGPVAGFNSTSGGSNIAIGECSGYNNGAGSKSIYLGFCSGFNNSTSNRLFIANSADPLIYGEFDNELVRISGSLYVNECSAIEPEFYAAWSGSKLVKTNTPILANVDGLLSSSQAWNITDGVSLTNVPSGSTLYFTGSDAIRFSLENSFTGSITLDTGSAHFNDGIKNKLNTEGVISGSIQVDHDQTFNFVFNKHIDHSLVNISAGLGLSGGGSIDITRTLNLNTGSSHFNDGIKDKLNTEGVISGSSQVIYNEITGIPSGILSSSQAWNITDGISLTNVPSGSTLYFTGSDAIAFDLINSTTGSITLDTGSAHFTSAVNQLINSQDALWFKCGVHALMPSGSETTCNIYLGKQAGECNASGLLNNVVIGTCAGYCIDGSGNVFLGAYAGFWETANNRLYIANSCHKPLIYGEFNNNLAKVSGSLYVTECAGLPTTESIYLAAWSGSKLITTDTPVSLGASGLLSSSQAWNITDGLVTTNVPSGSTLYFTGSDAIAFDLINSITGSITLDTSSAHFNDGIKTKLNTDNVLSGSQAWNIKGDTAGCTNIPSGSLLCIIGGNGTSTSLSSNTLTISNTLWEVATPGLYGYQQLSDPQFGNILLGISTGDGLIAGGNNNTFIGQYAGWCTTTGTSNLFIGPNSGICNTTGDYNVYLGHRAGYFNTTGGYNVFVGNNAGCNETNSNRLHIGNSADPLIYGEFDNQILHVSASLYVKDRTALPSATPHYLAAFSGSKLVETDFPVPVGTSGLFSGSIQVDHDQTLNYSADEHFTQANITTLGTVTSGNVTAILPSGTVSGSAQICGWNWYINNTLCGVVNPTQSFHFCSLSGITLTKCGTNCIGIEATDTFATGLGFNTTTGNLTLTRNNGATTITQSLDGRYLLPANDIYATSLSLTEGILYIGRTGGCPDITGPNLDSRYIYTNGNGISLTSKVFSVNAGTGLGFSAGALCVTKSVCALNFCNTDGVLRIGFTDTTSLTTDLDDRYVLISDKRLKSNIEKIEGGLSTLEMFNPYTYNLSGSDGLRSGFIAQEVCTVIPHAVVENSKGFLRLSMSDIVPYMHSAILELQDCIKQLEKRLDEKGS